MIYSVYLAALTDRLIWPTYNNDERGMRFHGKNTYELMAKLIKESKDDKFIFINTKAQEDTFNNFLKNYGLEEYVEYQMPYYITNGNHEYNGRYLRLTVLASKEQA